MLTSLVRDGLLWCTTDATPNVVASGWLVLWAERESHAAPRVHHDARRRGGGMAARGGAQQAGKLRTIGFLGPNAHSAANEWGAALAQRLRDVET